MNVHKAVRRTSFGVRPFLLLTLIAGLPLTSAFAQSSGAWWSGYGGDPQHTAISSVAAQPLQNIKWSAPLDLKPPYSGNDLFIHYGSPAITSANTVIFPVRLGSNNTFRIEAHKGTDGSLLWQQDTSYVLPDHGWIPPVGVTLAGNRLYYPSGAGLVSYRNNPDSATGTGGNWVFYGKNNYYAKPRVYQDAVRICTPLTADRFGNIYFGYQVKGDTPIGLKSGLAKITPAGRCSFVAVDTASGDNNVTHVVINCAPAVSNDGSKVYVAVSTGGYGFNAGYLLALDSRTLATVGKAELHDPSSGRFAYLPDDGTASPTVGPDGDVYFGVLENPFPAHHDRGWLLHFSADLKTSKIPGGFGWDDTASIVPASMVPSYHGTSSYLVMTKYNNYAGVSGDGHNRIGVLDPNASEPSFILPNVQVMRAVLTTLGVTPDEEFPNKPGAVREWCINTAAIDPATKSIIVNSEDGVMYRWDMKTNTLSEAVRLTPGIGEAYTPTVIGPDGTAYAINNATLFAVGK